jgi:hypothetical protein
LDLSLFLNVLSRKNIIFFLAIGLHTKKNPYEIIIYHEYTKFCIININIENAFLFAKLRQFKLLIKVCERVLNRKTYQNLPLLICVEFAHKMNRTTDLPIYQRIAPLTIETNTLHIKSGKF